jgi:hypothetical protein
MASSGKKKTTMAKLTRESRLRERRLDKQARKDARKRAPALDPDALDPDGRGDTPDAATDESAQPDAGLIALDAVAPVLGDA